MSNEWQEKQGRDAAISYCKYEMNIYQGLFALNHRRWRRWQIIAIVSGVIGTIVSAIQGDPLIMTWLRPIPVGIASIATTLLASFSYQADAIRQGSTGDLLAGELAKFVSGAAPYGSQVEDENVSAFINGIRAIIDSEQRNWQAQATLTTPTGQAQT